MTNEEKQLLIKDLCARLPYGVYVDIYSWQKDSPKLLVECIPEYVGEEIVVKNIVGRHPIKEVKPYLRPMSSMTQEERDEIEEMSHGWFYVNEDGEIFPVGQLTDSAEFEDAILPTLEWINKKMFDYRGLIEKGLALEAPEGMYKIG